MATKKITELPLIQTISGSYSVVPIVIGNVVGSGTTDQITIENFSRFVTAYSAHTGSAGNTFTGPQTINNNVTINGKLTVTELVATYETASIIYSEGGNIFGNELIDKQQFTGSSNFTGSVFINGQDYTIYSSSNSTVFTNFSSSNSTVFTNFSSSNSSYNTTFSSSNAAYVTALSSSNSNYNTIFSSSNSATITTLLAGTNSELARVYQTTASIQAQTASLLQFTASQDGRNFIISQYTSSTDAHIVGISDFTSSQLAVNLGNAIYTASVDSHIVGISTYTSSVRDTLSRVYQATQSLQLATASIQIQTASLLAFTASQDSRNFTLSQVTGSLIGITNGLMAFTAALDNTYATDAQLYQLYQATRSLELHSGSMVGITNELMALTASMKGQAIVSSSTQISNYYKFAETASANTTFYGGINVTDYSKFGKTGVAKALDVFGGISVTGSVITQQNSIGSFVGSYYTQWDSFGSQGGDGNASVGYFVGAFNDDRKLRLLSDADILLTHGINKKIQVAKASVGTSKVEITGSFNVTGSSALVGNAEINGGITVTEYSKFGKSGLAKAVDFSNAIAVTGSITTQANSIGGFVGSYYTQWDSFGSQGGDGNASVGYFVGTFNDDRKLRLLSDSDILLTTGINKKIQVAKASVGTSKVEITGSFNVTGSSTTVGNFEVLNGNIIGSVLATNGVLSGSVQIGELTQIAGIEAYTASLKGQAIVSSSTQISNYYKFAETASANTFYGDQTITGSLLINDSATNFLIEGNGFSQAYLTSNGAIVLNPGFGGVEMVGSYRTFKATDITADGFVSGEIRATNGVISGSVQLPEIAGIEAYTASLKGAIEVSGQNVNVLGMITAQQFNVTYVSSSVMYQSGSNKFGDDTGDIHQFTGSLNVSGALSVSGSLLVNGTSAVTIISNTAGNSTLNLISTNNANSGKIQFGGATYGATIEKNSLGADTGLIFNSYHSGPEGYTFQSNGSTKLKIGGSGKTEITGSLFVTGSSIYLKNTGGQSADFVADRPSTSLGATYGYNTNGVNKWYTGLRGLANENLYIFNNNTSANTVTFGSADDSAIFAGSVVSPSFYTSKTSTSIPFTTWTTLFDLNGNAGLFLFSVQLDGQDAADWAASGMVMSTGVSTGVTAQYVGTQNDGTYVQTRISGTTFQVYQNGTNPNVTMTFRAFRIG